MFSQKGFTLLELMIAMVISLFITGALLQLFITNKKNYAQIEQKASVQEGLRFALDTMAADLRQADSYSCAPKSRITIANTWSGTDVQTIFSGGMSGEDAYSGNYGLTPANNTTTSYSYYDSANIYRPDRIRFLTVTGGPIPLSADLNVNTGAAAGTNETIDIRPTDSFDGSQDNIGLLVFCGDQGDPQGGFLFHTTSGGSGVTSLTSSDPIQINPGTTDAAGNPSLTVIPQDKGFVYRLVLREYRIQMSTSSVLQSISSVSLFQEDVEDNALNPSSAAALVPNIENMQILYGIDGDENDSPEYYISATEVDSRSAWDRISAVRITLVGQSDADAVNLNLDGSRPTYRMPNSVMPSNNGSIDIDHTTDLVQTISPSSKPRNRQVLTATISLRN